MQEAGKALTVEQLCQMDGKPVLLKSPWWTEWCIVREHGEHEIAGDAISFTRRHYGEVCLGLSDYDKTWTAYAYQTAHIDREKWEPCEDCKNKTCDNCWHGYDTTGENGHCANCLEGSEWKAAYGFCPWCGRPLTEEAWAELERRCLG